MSHDYNQKVRILEYLKAAQRGMTNIEAADVLAIDDGTITEYRKEPAEGFDILGLHI